MRRFQWCAALVLVAGLVFVVTPEAPAQGRGGGGDLTKVREARNATEAELESVAIIERKVMVPMRDGKRMAADIYRPKDTSKKYGTIFVRTPYNFNYWDVRTGAPRAMTAELDAVKRGYAYVEMNERGHFFSEGNYDILGPPLTDGEDEFNWMSSRSWSNGKVGTIGCSSTAEWQMGVAARGIPSYAAMIPQGFGAGVGKVGPYYEQGNWYRGGAVQMLFIAWIYGEQNQIRPMFPPNTSQEDLIRASKAFDLAQQLPPVDWSKALQHLPVMDIIKAVDGPHGIFADKMPVDTGGAMIERAPNDPAWYKGGLWHEDHPINVPGFWFMSWYDVSIGPNLAAYNSTRQHARPDIANQQYAVIAPTLHCSYKRALEDTKVGERSMGDARLDYDAMTYGWFDHFLKGEDNHILEKMPKVKYFVMGANKWETSDTWPPQGAAPKTFYLSSAGKANTLKGDGALAGGPPNVDKADKFIYDPREPVSSYGGNVCCTGNAVQGGRLGSAQDGRTSGHSGLHDGAFQRRNGSQRADRRDALRFVRCERYRFHGEDHRRRAGWSGLQSGRDDPARPLPQRLRQTDRAHGKGQGVQGDAAAHDHQQLLHGRPQHPHRSIQQQFPALRPQHEHRRQQLR